MNITIDRSKAMQFQAVIGNSMTKKKKEPEKLSGEELMIRQFKEENSREKNRIKEIYAKFRAGKKLSPEEMDYIAKEAPELYRQVKEILMERQAMEAQMEMAESKEEVAQVHANQMSKIQATMGTGEEAEQNAEKNMARVNHMQAAFQEFTASVEYKEKEDMKSRTEEKRDLLEELEQQQKAYRDKITEKVEDIEDMTDGIIAETEEKDSVGVQDKVKEKMLEEALEFEDDKETVKHRKRGRKSQKAVSNPYITASVDIRDLRLKVKELYSSERKSTGKGVDLSL